MAFDNFKRKAPDEAFVSRVAAYVSKILDQRKADGPPTPGVTVLDIGCGMGQELFGVMDIFSSKTEKDGNEKGGVEVQYIALDMDLSMNLEAMEKFTGHGGIKTVDHTLPAALPFPDGSVDVIFARLSLHYFTDDVLRNQIFPDLRRILHPRDGALVFVVKSRENHTKTVTQKVLYGRDAWEQIVKDSGFSITKVETPFSAETQEEVKRWEESGAPWAFEVVVQ